MGEEGIPGGQGAEEVTESNEVSGMNETLESKIQEAGTNHV
jgi:hypothetical protein